MDYNQSVSGHGFVEGCREKVYEPNLKVSENRVLLKKQTLWTLSIGLIIVLTTQIEFSLRNVVSFNKNQDD